MKYETDSILINHLIDEMCDSVGLDLREETRRREVSLARQSAMYVLRTNFSDFTLVFIGGSFNGKDHATVSHAVKNVVDSLGFTDDWSIYVSDCVNRFTKIVNKYKKELGIKIKEVPNDGMVKNESLMQDKLHREKSKFRKLMLVNSEISNKLRKIENEMKKKDLRIKSLNRTVNSNNEIINDLIKKKDITLERRREIQELQRLSKYKEDYSL